jgi:hypothetical protein
MKTTLKKSVALPLLFAVLAATTVYPTHRAEAMVGLATGNPVIAVLGLASMAGGAGAFVYEATTSNDMISGYLDGLALGALGTIVGLTLLSDSASQDVAFAPITSPQAARSIGLTSAELAAYNDELDTINLIREDVASQIQGNSKQDVAKAASLWENYRDDLSPAAFSAMQKVAQSAVKK